MVLDGGNFLFRKALLKPMEVPQLTLKARKIIESYNEMKFDAAAVGPLDFSAGFKGLMELRALAKFPLLCGNLRWKDTGKLVFEPYVILERNGVRIGIIGIMDSSALPRGLGDLSDRLKLQSTYSTVARLSSELKKKHCDIVIVLSSIDYKKLRILAKNIKAVNMYIAGDPRDKLMIPFTVRNATIMSGTYFGKYLGRVRLSYDKGTENRPLISHTFVAMKPEKRDDPKIKRIVDGYYKAITLLRWKQPNMYVKESEETVNLEHDSPVYVSVRECKGCHKREYDRWTSTKHSVAYEKLPIGARRNVDCVECHVTGYGVWGGFAEAGATPDLTGVQCEECHGAGSSHPATMAMRRGKDIERVCRKCHTRSRSPGFSLRSYLERIRCDRTDERP